MLLGEIEIYPMQPPNEAHSADIIFKISRLVSSFIGGTAQADTDSFRSRPIRR
jgi:hypothetical protein